LGGVMELIRKVLQSSALRKAGCKIFRKVVFCSILPWVCEFHSPRSCSKNF